MISLKFWAVVKDIIRGTPRNHIIRMSHFHCHLVTMQADSSTSRTYGGTGIGLSISRCLVELMSGEMNFVSRPKVGSTFTFTAEFKSVPANVPESILREGSNCLLQTPPLPTCFQGMRVLVVDGRQVRCEVTRHHLRRLGIQVL